MSGGSGGGGSSTSTGTTTQINYSPEESARRTQVMDEANRIYTQVQGAATTSPYPGQAPVAFSPETQVAQNLAVQNAAGAQNSINQINQGVNYGLSGAMNVQNNPYLQQAMEAAARPINQSFTDAGGTFSQIRTGAENAGSYGGSRQGIAEGIAAGRQAQAIGDVTSKMGSEAYNKGQDTFSKTLMFAPQALDAGMTPVNWLSGVGAQKENLQAQQADYQTNQNLWALNSPWTPLQNYASLVFGGSSPGSSAATSTSNGNAPRSALGQAAGVGLTAASLYQMMQA